MLTNNSKYHICGGENVWVPCWITQAWDSNKTKSSDIKSVYSTPYATLCLLSHTVLPALKWNTYIVARGRSIKRAGIPAPDPALSPGWKCPCKSRMPNGIATSPSGWLGSLVYQDWRILAAAQTWGHMAGQYGPLWLSQKRIEWPKRGSHKSISNEVTKMGKENKDQVHCWIHWCLVCAFLALFSYFYLLTAGLTSWVEFSEVWWLFIVKAEKASVCDVCAGTFWGWNIWHHR